MADTVSKETRSRMMSGIRGKDTKPELELRRALFARGLRYRLHVKNLPGKPDIVLPRWKTVVFVHGCFWHGHSCSYFKLPGTNEDFWAKKIAGNRANDARQKKALVQGGWKVLTVWECSMRGAAGSKRERFFDRVAGRIRRHAV
jgi:DNA mismatch endonuclease, patch repair protein